MAWPARLAITSYRYRQDSGFLLRLSLPTVAPGPIPGALRFASLALHIPHIAWKAPQVRFSEENFRIVTASETYSKAHCESLAQVHRKTHSTQQACMNSRNQINITTAGTHRQPVFSHPIHFRLLPP